MIRREARRIVTSPLAWFCVVIYAAVLLMGIAETLKSKRGNIGSWLVRFVVCVRRIWHYNFGEKSGISYECCIGIF